MHLVNLTTYQLKRISILFIALIVYTNINAQDNSPYSRYGLGDILSGQNIVNRGLGGIAAAYSDFGIVGAPFNLNLINPASLGSVSNTKNFSNTIFDLGGEIDMRTLNSTVNTDKYKSANPVISYLQLGFPLSSKKMEKRGTSWGCSFGLRPITRINYKVEQAGRISNIDSTNTLYEGTGGMNQVNVSTGIKKTGKGNSKNEISIGFSTGYTFANKDYSTKLSLINDTVSYYKGNTEIKSRFGGMFLTAGLQYLIHVKNAGLLRFGAYANLKQNLNAKKTSINETFGYDANGAIIKIDSVSTISDAKGKVVIPATYGAGFTYNSKNQNWLFGADFEFTNWTSYKYYNETDKVANNWTLRAGVEYYPAKFNAANNKYLDYIKYRLGFYYGPDYIKLVDTRNSYAATIGATLPLTTPRYIQSRGEYVALNTSCEFGARGNRETVGLRENFVRINIGISMNARWFQKRSYD